MLNIPWDDHIPHKPFGTQLAFLAIPHLDAFFGGAAGGGKQILINEKMQIWRSSCRIKSKSDTILESKPVQGVLPMIVNAIDVQVGDYLIGPNGQPTKVLKKSIPELRKFYRITFDDGDYLDTSDDHNWLVYDLSKRAPGCDKRGTLVQVVTSRWLSRQELRFRDGNRFAIPLMSGPVEVPNPIKSNIPPYVLGYWLGNGCSQGSTLTCHTDDADEILSYVNKDMDQELIYKIYDPDAKRAKILLKGFIDLLKDVSWHCDIVKGIRKNRRVYNKTIIPDLSWRLWSKEDRLRLVQGIFDSDGHANNRGDWEFCNCNRTLVHLLREVMQSLGLKPSAIRSKKVRPNEQPIYQICGTSEIPIFRLKRKLNRLNTQKRTLRQYRRYIVGIEDIGIKEGVCFTVDNPEHLFVAGNNYIVTHNSDVLLMAALQYASFPGYSALLIRRSLTELKQPGALLDRAHQWLSGTDATWHGDEHTWSFPTKWPNGHPGPPSKLQFGYLGDFSVEQRYQGAEYQFIGVDEASHFETDYAPLYLFSRLRKIVCPVHKLKPDPKTGEMIPNYHKTCHKCQVYSAIPIRFRLASNPGGPGHRWLKDRYQIEKEIYETTDLDTQKPIKKVRFVGKHPNKPFVPSSLIDNIFIDQRSYRMSLQELDEVRKAQLEHGDWDVSPDSRFKLQWIKFYKSRGDYFDLGGTSYSVKDLHRIFVTVDPAATVKAGPIDQAMSRKGPSYTVISVWGLTQDYQLIWIYMRRFRKEIPDVVDQIVEVNKIFKPQYIKMETNGVGLGAAQLAMMKGVPVKPNPKSKDKLENASNAIYRMRSGRIWFPEQAPWLKEAMDEIFTWTGHPDMTDDIVDTLSDAANDVTWVAQGSDPIFERNTGLPGHMPKVIPMSTGYMKQFHNGPNLW